MVPANHLMAGWLHWISPTMEVDIVLTEIVIYAEYGSVFLFILHMPALRSVDL